MFLGVLMILGSSGIPRGIFVATTILLKILGLPIEVIGLLAGSFRMMDMGITTINILGSVVVAAIIGNKEISKKEESTSNSVSI
ncbi:MAG: cation:dicarboxylase symporter family transporter [Desulfitobacteriaceae bacterium]|nr:cation:dicarboxylase symporter family transporter [Desulfitobacteriaceae bacterium]MDI6879437.1 cation:dicarboxylase symporter family transporter [Desulfitobacteriaceae bacterium]MDI6915038.1 cation:dicarboxylase symporter family transporter [Desulfitobacteriaceae bacterium]